MPAGTFSNSMLWISFFATSWIQDAIEALDYMQKEKYIYFGALADSSSGEINNKKHKITKWGPMKN